MRRASGLRPTVSFHHRGVDVTAIETVHANAATPDPVGHASFRAAVARALRDKPDLMIAYGGDPIVHQALRQARAQGTRTVFSLRAWGYEDRRWFTHADRVLTPSLYLARGYRDRIGLYADGIPSPLDAAAILAPPEARSFVTIVNPSPHKGAALFARLAAMLGVARPDIPLLIVESGRSAQMLAGVPGLNLAQYSQILTIPALPNPRDIYALTRILLVPSVFDEPFGRVAAEAMLNGIPPLVSDRGGLSETVGPGGQVLPIPPWMRPDTRRIPEPHEVQPWFDAVTRLWDDPAAYAAAAAQAQTTANALYAEATLRPSYLAYLTDPGPYPPLFRD